MVRISRPVVPDEISYKRPAQKKEKASALDLVLEQFSETGATSKVLKTGRNALLLASKVPGGIPLQSELVSHINTFSDTFEFLDIFKSAKELACPSVKVNPVDPTKNQKAEKRRVKREKTIQVLHRVKAGLGVVTAGMVGVRLLDKFGVPKLAAINAKVGSIPVFGTIYNVLATGKASLEIASSSLKLVGLDEQAARAKQKKADWAFELTEAGEFAPFKPGLIEDRRQHLESKIDALENEGPSLEEKLKKAEYEFGDKLQAWEKDKTTQNKKAVIKAARAQDAVCDKIAAIESRIEVFENKYLKLAEIERMDDDQKAGFWKSKLDKWTVKAQHINKDKIKEGLTIATHVILVISLIASIVIAALGLQLLVVAITLSALFLLYAASSLTTHFVKKMLDLQKKNHPIPKAQIPAAA